ncbi:hypothetical protein LVD17_22375 [Fulvivirga ulvae]|uniref:hypothetical protein n=1 Tax=Fulvivirga ulvae TaxID=2904245 RepID=UPI001F452D19|nr:hypothetical protein [Fulvivirga ulvae]UII31042.1 hypothetical protein LVD17_22375 [Fulvivirga ulvae]
MDLLHKLYINQTDIDSDIPEWKALINTVSIGRSTQADTRMVLINNVSGKQVIEETWVGVIPLPKYYGNYSLIEEVVRSDFWYSSQKYCRGLFVFCASQKKILKACGVKSPIAVIPLHYNKSLDSPFKLSPVHKKILYAGGTMEKLEQFRLRLGSHGNEIIAILHDGTVVTDQEGDDAVAGLKKLDEVMYKQLLQSSIVVVDGHDDPRNITLIHDCVENCNPVIVSNWSMFKDKLGFQYPLFYGYLDEMFLFLSDLPYLQMGQNYLELQRNRNKTYEKDMIKAIEYSAIYQSLDETSTDKIVFKSFDLSVVIFISHHAKAELTPALESIIIHQQIDGKCEYIIWNSNVEASDAVFAFYEQHKSSVELKVITAFDSDANRSIEAMASLVRSQHILFIDNISELKSGFIDHLWQSKTQGDDKLYIAEIPYADKNDKKNNQAFLLHTRQLKKSLLFSNTEIQEIRNSGLAFTYIFSRYLRLPVVKCSPYGLRSKENQKTQLTYENQQD